MSDIEIAQAAKLRPISEIAATLDIAESKLFRYGEFIAKVQGEAPTPRGKLVLVTAITPTPAGEGKTMISIGLTQALAKLGKRVSVALREPSLGPVFGIKGGATGGGYSQVVPMDDINLHFTGDFHAITAANNLLCAMVDNHLQQGNALNLDPRQIEIRRVLDMNDRALRHVLVGLGGKSHGIPRESGFDITVASEIMAIMALATNLSDLLERLGRIRIGKNKDKQLVYARELQAQGAMAALLIKALEPNLVQTLEGQAAFVHMGPFANIAHGTNSVIATRMALGHADIVVTEAGFGADLGAEKFFNVVSRKAGFSPQAVVVVVTVRALRHHGGASDIQQADATAVGRGLANLEQHINIIKLHGFRPVLALNRFADDSQSELDIILEYAKRQDVNIAIANCHSQGGEGGIELAQKVLDSLEQDQKLVPLYDLDLPIADKIERIASSVYGAAGVTYTQTAKHALRHAEKEAKGLPVIMAKTPLSLSDKPTLKNRPTDFSVTVTDLKVRSGAGFVVAYMGDIMTMPGLPKTPAAEKITVDASGKIRGLF